MNKCGDVHRDQCFRFTGMFRIAWLMLFLFLHFSTSIFLFRLLFIYFFLVGFFSSVSISASYKSRAHKVKITTKNGTDTSKSLGTQTYTHISSLTHSRKTRITKYSPAKCFLLGWECFRCFIWCDDAHTQLVLSAHANLMRVYFISNAFSLFVNVCMCVSVEYVLYSLCIFSRLLFVICWCLSFEQIYDFRVYSPFFPLLSFLSLALAIFG